MPSTTTAHRAVDMFPDAMFHRAATTDVGITTAATMHHRGAIMEDGTMGRPSYALRHGAITATDYELGLVRAPFSSRCRLSVNQVALSWK
jgi:hypothetical protein